MKAAVTITSAHKHTPGFHPDIATRITCGAYTPVDVDDDGTIFPSSALPGCHKETWLPHDDPFGETLKGWAHFEYGYHLCPPCYHVYQMRWNPVYAAKHMMNEGNN